MVRMPFIVQVNDRIVAIDELSKYIANARASFSPEEAKELTEIGNKHFIRHTEVNQKPIIDQDQIDYLFYRMFAMILLILSKIDKWKIKQ